MADENVEFEKTDAGASHTYPQQAGEIRKGSHLMIKGHPCKCVEVSTSKTGKHGHAKAHIVGIDIFTGKKMEDLCPTSHNLDVPFVKRTEYQVLMVEESTGQVSLLCADGTPKDDLNLPTYTAEGNATDEDESIAKELLKEMNSGEKQVFAIVQSAVGKEKIVGVKCVG